MSLTKLREICKGVGIIHSKKSKEKIVEKIAKYYAKDPESERQFLETKRKLETKGINTLSKQHTFYRDAFNSVDLLDRLYYKCTAPYHVQHWRTKLFFSLFQVFLINSYTLYCEVLGDEGSIELGEYRELLGKYLILFNEEDMKRYSRKS